MLSEFSTLLVDRAAISLHPIYLLIGGCSYINMLHDWAMTAKNEGRKCGELQKRRMSVSYRSSTSDQETGDLPSSVGKEPPHWGEKEYWMRERFPAIKKAFQDFGEDRHSKRTLEDVGFSFEEWKKERIAEGRRLL